MRFSKVAALTLAVTVALVASACGDDDESTGSTGAPGAAVTEPGAEPPSVPTDTTAPSGSPETTGGPAPSGTSPAGETLYVGAVFSMTGPAAEFGVLGAAGVQARIDLINEAGGINGRHVELIVKDDGGDTQRAIDAFNEFIEEGQIEAVWPGLLSGSVAALAPLVRESGILGCGTGSLAELDDPSANPTLFSGLSGARTTLSIPLPAYAANEGYTRVALFAADNATGQAMVDLVAEHAPRYGVEVVATELFDVTSTDLTPQLSGLRDADPDAIIGWASATSIGVIGNGLRDLGWDVPYIGGPEGPGADLRTLVPDEVQGQFRFLVYSPVVRIDDQINEDIQPLIDRMKEAGVEVSALPAALAQSDCMVLFQYGWEKSGSFDAAEAAAAIEGITEDPSVAGSFALWPGGPPYTAEHRLTGLEDGCAGFLAVMEIGEVVDGTLPGEPLECRAPQG